MSSSPKQSKGYVSLSTVIGALIAFVVLIVAATTTSITYTVSIDALRSIGEDHALTLSTTANVKTEAKFNVTASSLLATAHTAELFNFSLPSADPDVAWADKWHRAMLAAAMTSGDNAGWLIIAFADGSYVGAGERYGFSYGHSHLKSVPSSTTNVSTENQEYFYRDPPFDPVPRSHSVYSHFNITWTPDIRSQYRGALSISGDGNIRKPFASSYQPQVGLLFLPLVAPVWNKNRLLGFAGSISSFNSLNRFVRDIQVTPNMEAFAISPPAFPGDPQRVIATSLAGRSNVVERPVTGSLKPKDCYTATATAYYCLLNINTYGFGPLASIPKEVLEVDGKMSLRHEHDGKLYFVGSTRVNTPIRLFTLNIVSIIPETDIIGEVLVGRNIAIGVSAALFVLASAFGFVCVWLVLRPLGGIAERMHRAAALEDDETDGDLSLMHEIFALQSAYYSMNTELNRLKSFVPMSVLAKEVDDEEEDELDAEMKDFQRGQQANVVTIEPPSTNASDTQSRMSTTSYTSSRPGLAVHGVSTEGRSRRGSVMSRVSAQPPPSSRVANPGALNVRSQLTRQSVSVLVLNLRMFHSQLGENCERLSRRMEALVDLVLRSAREMRGVLDSFQGDHFVVTFNAVQQATMHPTRAARCALRLCRAMKKSTASAGACRCTIGVSSGHAIIGNCGSSQMKRFCTVGGVFTRAAVLERLCKMYEVETLTHCKLFRDIESLTVYRCVDIVRLPFTKAPAALAVLESEAGYDADGGGRSDEEWMYHQQNASHKRRILDALNHCFVDLARNRPKDALAQLEKLDRESVERFEFTSMLDTLTLRVNKWTSAIEDSRSAESVSFVNRLDDYYWRAVLSRDLPKNEAVLVTSGEGDPLEHVALPGQNADDSQGGVSQGSSGSVTPRTGTGLDH